LVSTLTEHYESMKGSRILKIVAISHIFNLFGVNFVVIMNMQILKIVAISHIFNLFGVNFVVIMNMQKFLKSTD